MKKFEVPEMTMVPLVRDNIIRASSGCRSVCDGFTCERCDCTGYSTCIAAMVCSESYTCASGYECGSY